MVINANNIRAMSAVFNRVPPNDRHDHNVYIATLQELDLRICTMLSDFRIQERISSETLTLQWAYQENYAGESHRISTRVRACPLTVRLLTDFPPSPASTVILLMNNYWPSTPQINPPNQRDKMHFAQQPSNDFPNQPSVSRWSTICKVNPDCIISAQL